MSGIMKISFARGMPPAAVEVLSPDFQTVETLSLQAGEHREVPVPSEASFLRVHLPSGKIVTVQHPGNFDYHLDLAKLLGKEERALSAGPESYEPKIPAAGEIRKMAAGDYDEGIMPSIRWARFRVIDKGRGLQMGGNVEVEFGQTMEARLVAGGTRVTLRPAETLADGTRAEKWTVGYLRLFAPGGTLRLQLPGSLRRARIEVGEGVIRVSLATESELADSIGAYLLRGNYDAAKSMAQIVDGAYFALAAKRQDPVAATVAAYLLLRLERFDLLHDWARNLANWFPQMSDGAIIWACQLLAQGKEWDEAAKYLRMAADRELPIYTEGLRLLVEASDRLEGPESLALRRLTERAGQVNWNSPFTAGFFADNTSREQRRVFRIGYLNLP